MTLPVFNFDRAKLGVRWDDALQNPRFNKAKNSGLLDYLEVNFPISPAEDPTELGLPLLAHTSNNPLASVSGINLDVASGVKSGADRSQSPWIGEHLAWLGFMPSGALGYIFNPVFNDDFAQVAIQNIKALSLYYERPIALELGPVYDFRGDFSNELEFLSHVARESGSQIIWDLTHWMISNRNLKRASGDTLSSLDFKNVVEVHIAGMRPSQGGEFWHDAHALPPSDDVIDCLGDLLPELSGLRAVTLEYSLEGDEAGFFSSLEKIRGKMA